MTFNVAIVKQLSFNLSSTVYKACRYEPDNPYLLNISSQAQCQLSIIVNSDGGGNWTWAISGDVTNLPEVVSTLLCCTTVVRQIL